MAAALSMPYDTIAVFLTVYTVCDMGWGAGVELHDKAERVAKTHTMRQATVVQ